jgi:hypothetical protein
MQIDCSYNNIIMNVSESRLHTVTQSNLFLMMCWHVCLDDYFVICFSVQTAFEFDESVVHTGGD